MFDRKIKLTWIITRNGPCWNETEKVFEILCKTNMLQNEDYNNHEIKYEK